MLALNHPRPKLDPLATRARLQQGFRDDSPSRAKLCRGAAAEQPTTGALPAVRARGKALAALLQRERPYDGQVRTALGGWSGAVLFSDARPFAFDRETGAVLVGKTEDVELASQRLLLALASAATNSLGSSAFVVTYTDWADLAQAKLGWHLPPTRDSSVALAAVMAKEPGEPGRPPAATPPPVTFEGAPAGRFYDAQWGGWPPPVLTPQPPRKTEGFQAAGAGPEQGEQGQVQADQVVTERTWAVPDPYKDNPYRALQQQPGDRPNPGSQFKTIWAQGSGLETIGGVLPPSMQPHLVRVPKPWTDVPYTGYALPAPISSAAAGDPLGSSNKAPIFPPEPRPDPPMQLERPCSEAGGAYDTCCAAKSHNGEYDGSCRPPVRSEWSEVVGWPVDTAIKEIQRHNPELRVESLVAGTANMLPPDPRRVTVIYDVRTNRVAEAPRREWPLPEPKQDPSGLAMLVGQDATQAISYVQGNYPNLAAVAWPNNVPLPTEGLPNRIIIVYNAADMKVTRVPFFG